METALRWNEEGGALLLWNEELLRGVVVVHFCVSLLSDLINNNEA
jgi:hypothetical protein